MSSRLAAITLLALMGARSATAAGSVPLAEGVPDVGAAVDVTPSWTRIPDGAPRSDSPSQHDRQDFWEELRDGVFDQVCRQIQLQTGTSLNAGEYVTVGVKVKRRIRRYADGGLALVDEAPLRLSLGWSSALWKLGERGTVGVRLGGRLEGTSMVVRPLTNARSCKELDRLLNVLDFKTILPLSGERIAKMGVGELWKVPVRFEVGGGPAVGATMSHGSVVLHAGAYKSREAMLTLYRRSAEELRLRVRLDRATTLRGGVEATATTEAAELGLDIAENVFADVIDSEVSRELVRVLQARFSWSENLSEKGSASLLEFVLDPSDADQMERVAKVAMGDLNVLASWAKGGRKTASKGAAPEELSSDLASAHAAGLGQEAGYSGTDSFQRSGRALELKVPALLGLSGASGLSVDRIGTAGEDSVVHAASADRSWSRKAVFVPWLGYLTRHDLSRSAQLYFDESADGDAGRPAAVYIQQEGFAAEAAREPRIMTERADSIMRLVGARGGAPLSGAALPMAELFPAGEKVPVGYDGGVTAFTLILGKDALASMMAASPDELVDAYLNTVDVERRGFAKEVLRSRGFDKEGHLLWDPKAASRTAPPDARGGALLSHYQAVDKVRGAVESIRGELAKARASGSRAEQADVFRRLMAREDALKVLVQFADPRQVAGEFIIHVEKGGKREDLKARYQFNPGLPDAAEVAALKDKRDRLKKPSPLQD